MKRSEMTLGDLRSALRKNSLNVDGSVLYGSSSPIVTDGLAVLGMVSIPVSAGDIFRVNLRRKSRGKHQGLHFALTDGLLRVGETEWEEVKVWTDLTLRGSDLNLEVLNVGSGILNVWNIWRSKKATVDRSEAWSGNSGMLATEDNGIWRLRCSDNGTNAVDFSSLQVDLAKLS